MKANEITEEGFYWYNGMDGVKLIEVCVIVELCFFAMGTDKMFTQSQFSGDFIGPIDLAKIANFPVAKT